VEPAGEARAELDERQPLRGARHAGLPGDGFVGSKSGKLGGPPQEPSPPPDDKPYSERSTFCANVVQLPDGRMLMAGGPTTTTAAPWARRDNPR
jgi:hypothetical protein